MDLLPNLETLTRQVRAAADNLTKDENKVGSSQIVLGRLLNLGRAIWGWPEAGTGLHGNGAASPYTNVVDNLTFQQWCVSSSGRSWKTCTIYMSLGVNPAAEAGRRVRHIERNIAAQVLGREEVRRRRLGVEPQLPVPPKSIPTDPVECAKMARQYRIDNAVACMLALAVDEYEEALNRVIDKRGRPCTIMQLTSEPTEKTIVAKRKPIARRTVRPSAPTIEPTTLAMSA